MTSISRRAQGVLLVGALASWSVAGLAQVPERLSDKDVKVLVDQVDEGRDKFEGNLDGQFKGSTLRGPAGETKFATPTTRWAMSATPYRRSMKR